MPNTSSIKSRIKSVNNTKQITKAMELVAASKMRKSQEAALKSKAYRNTARELLTRIDREIDVAANPLFQARPVKNKLYILITSDRGLAGAYNTLILKFFVNQLQLDKTQNITSQVIAIGKQGAKLVTKLDSVEVVGVYENFADPATTSDIKPILDTALNSFKSDEVQQVQVVYTDFISTVKQEPKVQTILPAAYETAVSPADLPPQKGEVPFEPSPEKLVETIVPKLVEVQLYQDVVESQASEHVSRMLAMKNASDNAGDIIDALTAEFNSIRQASITQEIAEITAGSEAIV